MQPLQDLLHRITWDPVFGKGELSLGYEDRVGREQRIVPFTSSRIDPQRHETYRVFVAISLPEPVKNAIEDAQQQLRGVVPGKSVRWSKREQLHLTLKFLGDVEVPRLDALTASIRSACAGSGALHLRAGQIGFFPDARRPRMVWTGVRDERGQLPALQRAVERAAAEFTSQSPEPEFTGHITLGRCRTITRQEAETLSTSAKAIGNRVFGTWTADHLDVVRSLLSPAGSHYVTLATLPLTTSTP